MDTPYNQQPYRFNINDEDDEEVSENPTPAYHFGYLSSITTENKAKTLQDASPVSIYPNTESGLPTGVSQTNTSFASSSIQMRRLSPTRFDHDYGREPLSDGLFHSGNSISERQDQQLIPLTTTHQHIRYTYNATESTNQFLDPCENGRTIPTFVSGDLSDAPGPSYGSPTRYFPPYGGIQDPYRSINEYSKVPVTPVEDWSLDLSPSYHIRNSIDVSTLTMSTDLAGQKSPFSNMDEIPPSSSMEDFRCLTCSPPRIFENSNILGLHYWDTHAPPAGSPGGWRACKCIWDRCNLEKEFTTHKTWLDHAKTVHYRRFKCRWDDCDWPRLFGSQNSLNRHILTKHEPPENCKIPGCQGSKAKIGRKDKKTEHNAHFHGPHVCEVEGCPRGCIDGQDHGFSDPKELIKHIKNKHKYLDSQKLVN